MLQDYCHCFHVVSINNSPVRQALWFLGPVLNYHVGQLPLSLFNWKAAVVKTVL